MIAPLSRLDQVRALWTNDTTRTFSLSVGIPPELVRRRLYLAWFINPDPGATLSDYDLESDVIITASGQETWRLPLKMDDQGSGADLSAGEVVWNSIVPPWRLSRIDRASGASLQDLDTGAGDDDLVTVWHVPETPYDWLIAAKMSPVRCSSPGDRIEWRGTLTCPVVGAFSYGFFLGVQSEGGRT